MAGMITVNLREVCHRWHGVKGCGSSSIGCIFCNRTGYSGTGRLGKRVREAGLEVLKMLVGSKNRQRH